MCWQLTCTMPCRKTFWSLWEGAFQGPTSAVPDETCTHWWEMRCGHSFHISGIQQWIICLLNLINRQSIMLTWVRTQTKSLNNYKPNQQSSMHINGVGWTGRCNIRKVKCRDHQSVMLSIYYRLTQHKSLDVCLNFQL